MNTSRKIRQQRLGQAQLYVLLDGGPSPQQFRRRAQQIVAAGVHVVQLRDKTLDDRSQLERALQLREAAESCGTLFIMNDRPDIALLADADGVHIGQDELSVPDARRVIGPDRLLGVSTHTIQQARQAVADGADYIGCGPTYPSGTKQFDDFPGTPFLSEVAREIRIPAFAIGGISVQNLKHVLQTGLRRIAVSGAVTGAEDIAHAVGQLLDQLHEAS